MSSTLSEVRRLGTAGPVSRGQWCQAWPQRRHAPRPTSDALTASLQAHDEVCPKFPLACDGCGKKKIPREKVSSFPAAPRPGCGRSLGRGAALRGVGVAAWRLSGSRRGLVWGRLGRFVVTQPVTQTMSMAQAERALWGPGRS